MLRAPLHHLVHLCLIDVPKRKPPAEGNSRRMNLTKLPYWWKER